MPCLACRASPGLMAALCLPCQVYVERMAKAVRRSRHEAEKKAAEEMAERLTSASNHPGTQPEPTAACCPTSCMPVTAVLHGSPMH